VLSLNVVVARPKPRHTLLALIGLHTKSWLRPWFMFELIYIIAAVISVVLSCRKLRD